MTTSDVLVTHWEAANPPTKSLLLEIMKQQGLDPHLWSNNPYDSYSAHKHAFHKVIYVVQGSITFVLPILGKRVLLTAGDRLDLPRDVVHAAEVGSDGVVCLEGHR